MATIENEISYSINFSQDLLYIILDSYISKKFKVCEEYYDFVDENNVRTRLSNGTFTSVRKSCKSLDKFVHVDGGMLVPFVDRCSVEEPVTTVSPMLRRLVKCRVYRSAECPECDVKFEHIYLNKTLIDRFDSLMATKQIALWNLLQNKNENLVRESHLGSDEIMAALRLEYEYDEIGGGKLDRRVLDFMAGVICDMDALASYQNIGPLMPYTTLQNTIIYRKFEDEKLLYEDANKGTGGDDGETSIHKWALKLDGTRGKGFFTKTFIIVFMDDMQIFSGNFETTNVDGGDDNKNKIFTLNNVVAFQCELIGSTLYITDLLHVFKYGYNNRTQYEVSLDPYRIEPAAAVECINHLAAKFNGANASAGIRLKTMHQDTIGVRFQQFFDPPMASSGYSTMPTDGFVVLDKSMRYVKYKQQKTVEVEYDSEQNLFKSLTGPLVHRHVVLSPHVNQPLQHQAIYEAVITDTHVTILKHRPDRLVPN
ncbi:agip91 [Agrotis ipsilon multiple nucleopolyhedrovirus]|uniref:Late expression factor-4 n=1 Tax=Agrotis ipsilon multiple nucleopolyhedrovirus TaxID=208013 RepID=B6D605_9ABAC|nr:agip91 [Agrotis ipsilon multiple nucleopolyhedrovirus]ACI28792.1 late expression factor-4 [Agrotis ipsilon multiple nucleopolyhedrovirus]